MKRAPFLDNPRRGVSEPLRRHESPADYATPIEHFPKRWRPVLSGFEWGAVFAIVCALAGLYFAAG